MNRSSLMRMAVTFLTAQPVMGFACAGASVTGKPVHFGDQVNIIIWDAATKTEHFVRQAFFQSEAKQFGFIAPTPTKPALSEADDAAFKTLTALNPSKSNYAAPMNARAFGGLLQIVQEQDVGVYHAATVLASSASALSDWMKANGYATTPAIEEWTQKYIAEGWYLTTFKVRNPTGEVGTATVRMSFHTNRPFNPYYVPADNIGLRASLAVFFVAKDSYVPHIGKSEPWVKVQWEAPVPAASRQLLARQLKLPMSAIPVDAHVQAFQDYRFPSAAREDIFFTPASNVQAWQAPIITGVLLLFLLLLGKQLRGRARRLQPA